MRQEDGGSWSEFRNCGLRVGLSVISESMAQERASEAKEKCSTCVVWSPPSTLLCFRGRSVKFTILTVDPASPHRFLFAYLLESPPVTWFSLFYISVLYSSSEPSSELNLTPPHPPPTPPPPHSPALLNVILDPLTLSISRLLTSFGLALLPGWSAL